MSIGCLPCLPAVTDGNAENHFGDDGPGTMEAIYYGNCTGWWAKDDRSHIPKSWHGPIVMADLEAGMYVGNDIRTAQPIHTRT